ncbi:MAG: type II toxin-antitoxin system HicB family antitoxin [Planctomycetes bacterium]|nr:type II toxin-antitoxin system HicB family antitoxin [Planctomycetota bacterium]
MNTMMYKGYGGSVEFSREENILFGRVLGIRHVIDYEGESISELEQDFHNAVDSYLSVCKEEGIRPEKPRSGKLLLRLPPDVHAGLARVSETTGQSTNQLIVDAVRVQYLGETPDPNPPRQRGKKWRKEMIGA